jgi:hypothetical protein
MKKRKIILAGLLLLAVWIITDLNYPFKTDIKKFNAAETARLDGAMWRSYYEKKRVKLFMQSATLMRNQFHIPFWRSNRMAYQVAKAAFVFKDGMNRTDYEKAMPSLTSYYKSIHRISDVSFDAEKAARLELEWWIIRRERLQHPPAEWEKYLAEGAEVVYHIPAEKFNEYAHLRVNAMLLRDNKGASITENDWQQIDSLLQKAWLSFYDNLH